MHEDRKNHPAGYWTLDRCRDSALPFDNKGKWKCNFPVAYQVARKNKWLEICCLHMKALRNVCGFYTKEKCQEFALKCNNAKEFKEKYFKIQAIARNHGWIKEITSHFSPLKMVTGYYSLEICKQDALKYNYKVEWARQSSSAYQKARKNGWLEECCKHMLLQGSLQNRKIYAFEFFDNSVYVGLTCNYSKRYEGHKKNSTWYKQKLNIQYIFKKFDVLYPKEIAATKEQELIEEYRKNGWTILNVNKAGGLGGNTLKWTSLELCKNEALKYKNKTDWHENSSGSYKSAKDNGWFEKCCAHMDLLEMPKNYWTLERCKEEAKKFKGRTEWARKSASSYRKALCMGWLDVCTLHMKYKNIRDLL